jgi:opacity protein-like surface antigen
MRKILIATGCVVLLCFSTIAYSADGPYVSGHVGIAIASDSDVTDSTAPGIPITVESDAGFALGGAVGYSAGDARGEVEIAYQKNNLDKQTVPGFPVMELTGDTTLLSVLVNGYYDFDTGGPFTPFVSAGLGFAKFDINDAKVVGSPSPATNDDDTVFAYQLGAGVGYAVNERVSIDIRYRYLATTDPEVDTVTIEYSGHNFLAGVRSSF